MARTRLVAMPQFTLGEMQAKTNVPIRLLQFWSDSRVIQPEGATEHRGRGVARRYSLIELQIASLLWPLSVAGLQIGNLKGFAFFLRGALDGSLRDRQRMVGGAILDVAALRHALDRAARGEGSNYFTLATAPDGRGVAAVWTGETGETPRIDLPYPDDFPRGDAAIITLSLTERLSRLFTE